MNKKIVISISSILIIVFLVAGFKTFLNKEKGENEVKPLMVENIDLKSNIYTNGIVITDEERKINYDGTGVVEDVFVKKGEIVEDNQILAKIKSDQLENDVRLKRLQIEIEQEKLDQMIKEGDNSLVIALENAKLQLEEAKRNYDANKTLFDGGAINESELEKSRSSFEQCQNALKEAKSRLKNSSSASNIYIQRKNIEIAKLELEQLEKNLEKTTIRSSINGTVTEVKLQSGEAFERKDYMFNIQNFTKNEIVADISEADINKVKLGQKVEITGNSIKGKKLYGKVSAIAPGIKNVPGKKQAYVEIRIIPDEYIPSLRTGFSVNLIINCASKENVKAVKFEAINTDIEGNKYVNLIDGTSTIKKVPVKIGLEGDVYTEIISEEIKVGDKLLINDDFKNVQSEDEIMF